MPRISDLVCCGYQYETTEEVDAHRQSGECEEWKNDPFAPCPRHVEVPGQNCPTCGF